MANWISRIFGKRDEKRFHPSQDDASFGRNYLVMAATSSGVNVTEQTALTDMAVYACVRVLAETVASLPLMVYERQERGKRRAPDHYLYRILHDAPNPEMTAFEFFETVVGHVALWGNAYCEIERDRAGRVIGLWPLRPDRMSVTRNAAKQLVYVYTLPESVGGGDVGLRADQVLHVRGLGSNGLIGYSPIALAREAIGLSLATQKYGAKFFGNGARPGGLLVHPGTLKDDVFTRLQRSWNEMYQGLDNSHRLAILEEGMKYESMGVPPEDAQFLETRKFQATEIARMFRVPPHMIADLDRATFSNIEQQSLEFKIYTIDPWLERIEQRIMASLFLPSERERYYAEFLTDALMRGDLMSRYQAYAVGRQWGWFSVNDIREMENMNPVDGGDEYMVPMNMIPAGEAAEMPETPDEAAPEESGRSVAQRSAAVLGSEAVEERARKVQGRYRLMRSYRRVFRAVIERIGKREAQDVGAAVKRFFGQRDQLGFEMWLESYYRENGDLADYIRRQMGPVEQAYAELVGEAVAGEIKKPVDAEQLDGFVRAYVAEFERRYTIKSQDKLTAAIALALKEGRDPLTVLEAELEDWYGERADSTANAEAVRGGNALTKLLMANAGVTVLRWYSMGDNACPYCSEMNGRVVGIENNFADEGTAMDGGENGPLNLSHNIGHPPLHDGCECMIGAG